LSTFTPLRWGFLGCGSIANRLGTDVAKLSDHKIQAIASRDATKAAEYAAKFGVPTQHTGPDAYQKLVNDPDIDIVYVATPHNFHFEQASLALSAGKPVLCEKPFTVNLKEAEALVTLARAKNLFLMEGVWSRLFPVWVKVRELIASGEIGQVRQVYSDFGYGAGSLGADNKLVIGNPNGRLFSKDLIGGGLMDVGVYPINIAMMLLGVPNVVKAFGQLGSTGVDENVGVVLGFESGALATCTTSIQVTTPFQTTIIGTAGRIEVPFWWRPKSFTLHKNGQTEFTFEHEGEGFQFEAMHVAECLRAGKTESDVLPLDETLAVMGVLDKVRAEIGLTYPGE
jgi:predicted dehydrogenase